MCITKIVILEYFIYNVDPYFTTLAISEVSLLVKISYSPPRIIPLYIKVQTFQCKPDDKLFTEM